MAEAKPKKYKVKFLKPVVGFAYFEGDTGEILLKPETFKKLVESKHIELQKESK